MSADDVIVVEKVARATRPAEQQQQQRASSVIAPSPSPSEHPATSRVPIEARWSRARAALLHAGQLGRASAPAHWDCHQVNESCKSMPFARCSTSSDVPPQTSRMSKAEYAVTSCQPGLEHPNSKWSMSTRSWCCATIAQHKDGGWRARDERVRKRSGRREGRMQHARLRDTAQSSHERRSRATAAADIRRALFLLTYLVTYLLT